MAKIGTAHVEIKPVLNDEALELIASRIEAAVKAGVEAGVRAARPTELDWASRSRDARVAITKAYAADDTAETP